MIKILYIFFFALVVSNCSFKKVVKHHGVPFLEKKQKQLIIDKSTSNDVRRILGTPSTRSKFYNDVNDNYKKLFNNDNLELDSFKNTALIIISAAILLALVVWLLPKFGINFLGILQKIIPVVSSLRGILPF